MAIKKKYKPETQLQHAYQRFWQKFNKVTATNDEFCKVFIPHPYGSIRSYQDYSVGDSYAIVAGINFKSKEVRVGAYFRSLVAFDLFAENKALIEDRIGKKLAWKRHLTKASVTVIDSVDFDDDYGWENAFKIMIPLMLQMREVFQ